MRKKKIEDITPPEKKTVRNISLSSRAHKKASPEERSAGDTVQLRSESALPPLSPPSFSTESSFKKPPLVSDPAFSQPLSPRQSVLPPVSPPVYIPPTVRENAGHPERSRAKIFIWSAFAVFVLLLGFVGADKFLFGATIRITPKTLAAPLEIASAADLEPAAGGLRFEVMVLEREGSEVVPETGSKKIEKRAMGKITISNNYSKAPQRLIRNTRFQSSGGLIFRIDQSVVVPGQEVKNGEIIPGKIEVVVFADTAGEEYNIPANDFTIPGFKGDPRYAKFAARSSLPMSGGFIGTVKTASPQDIAKAEENLKGKLAAELLAAADAGRPKDYLLFEKAKFLDFENFSAPESNEVKIKGVFHGIVFNAQEFAHFFSLRVIPDLEEGAMVSILNPESLSFEPDPEEVIPWKTGHLPFSLGGEALFRWNLDEEKFKMDIVGKTKELILRDVLPSYSSIQSADISIRPFWKQLLPKNADAVIIEYQSFGQ